MTTPIDVQKAREIIEGVINSGKYYWAFDNYADLLTIHSTLDALVKENEELREGKLLINVTHIHSDETWDYRITPSELDDTGITIECGAFDEQRYLIKIIKETTMTPPDV